MPVGCGRDPEVVRGPKIYQLVIRGEVGDQFAVLFPGMRFARHDGLTTLTGPVIDEVQLLGLVERTQELGFELLSLDQLPGDAPRPAPRTPGGCLQTGLPITHIEQDSVRTETGRRVNGSQPKPPTARTSSRSSS